MTEMPTSGPEHAREARRLLARTKKSESSRYGQTGSVAREVARQQLAEAQLHIGFALLAAMAATGDLPPVWQQIVREWEQGDDSEAAS